MTSKNIFLTVLLWLIFIPLSLAEDSENKKDEEPEAVIRLQSNIIGDKEQPSVSYFIPWKGTDSPDELRWQAEQKNDDTLGIVDRNIMLRSMNIYKGMNFERGDK